MLALMTSQAQHPGDRMRDRWADDESVLSAWSTLADPVIVETIASTGVDAVVVDLQQGHTDWGLSASVGAGHPPRRRCSHRASSVAPSGAADGH